MTTSTSESTKWQFAIKGWDGKIELSPKLGSYTNAKGVLLSFMGRTFKDFGIEAAADLSRNTHEAPWESEVRVREPYYGAKLKIKHRWRTYQVSLFPADSSQE